MARPRKGSITPAGEGRWRVRATAGKKRLSAYVLGTKDDATDELHKMLANAVTERHVAPKGSVSHLLERWLDVIDVAESTRMDWRSVIRKHIDPHIGHRQAHRVKGADLDAYYAKLRKSGVSAERIRRVHSVLRLAFAQAVKWREVAHNPTADATAPRQVKREPVSPTTEDMERLLVVAEKEHPGLGAWLSIAADVGARRGEICRLRWGDFEETFGSLLVTPTKGGRPRRVALGPQTVKSLKRWKRACQKESMAAGRRFDDKAFMFRNAITGKPWRGDMVGHWVLDVRRANGLEHVRIHHLRHYVATQLLAAGMDARTVAERLGHARPSTTTDIYAAWVPARDQEAAAVLARLRAKG